MRAAARALPHAGEIFPGQLEESFLDSFFHLLNSETDRPVKEKGEPSPAWWKEAAIYQITHAPSAIRMETGSAISAASSKLDDLKELGVTRSGCRLFTNRRTTTTATMFDYPDITRFWTMEDFDLLMAELKKRGMRLIMDMVLNHTSTSTRGFRKH